MFHCTVENVQCLFVLSQRGIVLCEKEEGPEIVGGVRGCGWRCLIFRRDARPDIFDNVLDGLELEWVRVEVFDVAKEGRNPFFKCALEIGFDQCLERVAWKGCERGRLGYHCGLPSAIESASRRCVFALGCLEENSSRMPRALVRDSSVRLSFMV